MAYIREICRPFLPGGFLHCRLRHSPGRRPFPPAFSVKQENSHRQCKKQNRPGQLRIFIKDGNDTFPIGADPPAEEDEHKIPDDRAEGGVKQKYRHVHLCNAGRDGDQAAYDWHEPAEKDRPRPVQIKPVDRIFDILRPDAQNPPCPPETSCFSRSFFSSLPR